jgi:hypothetical protein
MTSTPHTFLDLTDQEFFDMYCEEESCDVTSLPLVLSVLHNLCSDFHYSVRKRHHIQKTVKLAGLAVPMVPSSSFFAAASPSTVLE